MKLIESAADSPVEVAADEDDLKGGSPTGRNVVTMSVKPSVFEVQVVTKGRNILPEVVTCRK